MKGRLFVVALALTLGCAGFVAVARPSASGPAAPSDLPARLEADVRALAEGIGERNHGRRPDALRAAEEWVETRFREAGIDPSSESVPYSRNIVATVPGAESGMVIVGAHFDSAEGTPGADDNASGVAVMLELARRFANRPQSRALRFVAFANEESPYFRTGESGSRVHARACRDADEEVVAMYSIESVGYYDARPGTQRYPFPFALFMPSTADYVALIGNVPSIGLVRKTRIAFRAASNLPAAAMALPASVPGVDWSDHREFWALGYPAVMVTDMPPNRNPHYHQPTDTADRLDYRRLAAVVTGMEGVIFSVAN